MKTYSIVGMNWQKTEQFVAALGVGTPVVLVREPKNPFDPNAIGVWVDGTKIGFLPKKQNAALAQFMDQTGQFLPDFDPGIAAKMAMDGQPNGVRSMAAIFARSPNSGYPQVQVRDTVETDRRTFLVGLGAAIVAIKAPLSNGARCRIFSPFTLPATSYAFTAQTLIDAVTDLGRQVSTLGALNQPERTAVAKLVDDAIDMIRPVGLLVNLSASLDDIVRGEFYILEGFPGTVDIISNQRIVR